jgi:hypothetical protein
MVGARQIGGEGARMATYRGSCHCGRVTFEVDADLSALTECNCSLCRRKGALYIPVRSIERVRIVTGESELSLYQFNTGAAKHYFCRHCGIHPFHRPRIAPEGWSVNARCLEDVDLDPLPRRHFDGQNWEQAAARDRETQR